MIGGSVRPGVPRPQYRCERLSGLVQIAVQRMEPSSVFHEVPDKAEEETKESGIPRRDEEYGALGRFHLVQRCTARPFIWVTCGNALRITPLTFRMAITGG
jgi:hypothetical protein